MIRRFRLASAGLYRGLFPAGQSAVMVAFSVFVGVFIGVLPTIGFALPLTVLATAAFRLPKGPGLAASFVATPPTLFLFFYPAGYFLGGSLTHPPHVDVDLLAQLHAVTPSTLYAVIGQLWKDARLHVLAFMLGMLIVSLLTAAIVSAGANWIIARRAARLRS